MEVPLDQRIRRLEDIEAIRQLKARYCQACDDDHNPDAVAALFIEDGLWEGVGTGPHARGHAAIKDFMGGIRRSGRIVRSAHMVFNPIIEVEGDRARGFWQLLMMYTGRAAGGGIEHHRIIGFYEDVYVRLGGAWRFAELHVTVEESGPYAMANAEPWPARAPS